MAKAKNAKPKERKEDENAASEGSRARSSTELQAPGARWGSLVAVLDSLPSPTGGPAITQQPPPYNVGPGAATHSTIQHILRYISSLARYM